MSIEVMAVLGSAIGGLISFFFGYSVGRWAKSRAFRSSVLERDVKRIVLNPSSDNPRTFVPESENAKLRELVRHMHTCMEHYEIDGTISCDRCPLDNDTGNCDFERRMRELGVEVSE